MLAGAELLVAAAVFHHRTDYRNITTAQNKLQTSKVLAGWLLLRTGSEKRERREREREGESLRCDIQPSPGQPGYLR